MLDHASTPPLSWNSLLTNTWPRRPPNSVGAVTGSRLLCKKEPIDSSSGRPWEQISGAPRVRPT
eukprot:206918-Pyramimonas_sp.AAC.1